MFVTVSLFNRVKILSTGDLDPSLGCDLGNNCDRSTDLDIPIDLFLLF